MDIIKASLEYTMLRYIVTLTLMLGIAQGLLEEKPVEYNVFEESPANTFIGDIAKDAHIAEEFDDAVFKTLTYELLGKGGDNSQYFDVEKNTGTLRIKKKIDRESIKSCKQKEVCSINLDVALKPVAYFRIIKISIHIKDSNDNPPSFLESPISRSIAEDTAPGRSFAIPSADDLDSPQYGIKRYTLLKGSPTFDLRVTNNSDGTYDLHLVLKEKVDREIQEKYQVTVAAYDGGVPSKSGLLTVDIIILDVNDNMPEFDNQTYRVTILENIQTQVPILKVHASDSDYGVNGEVVYGFATKTERSYGSVFGINEETGNIYLKSKLDFRSEEEYILVITAKDKNPESLPVSTKVIVTLKDVNDHAPEIRINSMTQDGTVSVSESAKNSSFVALISVEDNDVGNNGKFNCELDKQDNFKLVKIYETEFKIVTAAPLDRETRSEYSVKLICEDFGSPRMASEIPIKITVLDENDNRPIFTQEVYNSRVSENNAPGVQIAQVFATDKDTGDNAEIRYNFAEEIASKMFAIDRTRGIVTARRSFDYETERKFQVLIVAHDLSSEPVSATATLQVQITDTNDEAPKFQQEIYSFGIYENGEPISEVGQVSAFDADSDPYNQFKYRLSPDMPDYIGDVFSVNEDNGKIFTRATLDREQEPVYNMIILAVSQDELDATSSATVTVYVADRNDNSPVITYPSDMNNTVHISNRSPLGYVFTRIHAYDIDGGNNAKLSYSITKGNDGLYFAIGEWNGVLSINEEVKHYNYRNFELTILVSDHGTPPRSAETMVNIFVNKSIAYPGAMGHHAVTKQNLTIVISVIVITIIITAILLSLIIIIKRQDNRERKSKYMSQLLVSDKRQNGMTDIEAGKKLEDSKQQSREELGGETQWPAHRDGLLPENAKGNSTARACSIQIKASGKKATIASEDLPATVNGYYDPVKAPTVKTARNLQPGDVLLLEQNGSHDSDHSMDQERLSNADSGRGSNEDGADANRNSVGDLDTSVHRDNPVSPAKIQHHLPPRRIEPNYKNHANDMNRHLRTGMNTLPHTRGHHLDHTNVPLHITRSRSSPRNVDFTNANHYGNGRQWRTDDIELAPHMNASHV